MTWIKLVRVWCGIQFLRMYRCSSESSSLCDLSIDVNGKTICYWLITTRQNASSSEEICRQDDGTLAYIANEETFQRISIYIGEQLPGDWNFVFFGYRKSSEGDIVLQETEQVHSWLEWDTEYLQPDSNDEDCIALFTYHEKFHDASCHTAMYAMCSTPSESEISTKEATTYATNERTDDVTIGTPATANTTSCCRCYSGRGIVIYATVNITRKLQAKLDALKEETKVDEESLSSTIRRKTSASDPRPSSAYVGYLGIVLLTLVFGGILLMDLPRMIKVLKTLC